MWKEGERQLIHVISDTCMIHVANQIRMILHLYNYHSFRNVTSEMLNI